MNENEIMLGSPEEVEIECWNIFQTSPIDSRMNGGSQVCCLVTRLSSSVVISTSCCILTSPPISRLRATNCVLDTPPRLWQDPKYDLQDGELLTIRKFEVAVVEILETVNMPAFLNRTLEYPN